MFVLESSKGLHDDPVSRNTGRTVRPPSGPDRTALLPTFPTNTIHDDKETQQAVISQLQGAPLSVGPSTGC